MDACNTCGTQAAKGLKACSGCKSVGYCCKECQKADWPRHKQACKFVSDLKAKGQGWEEDTVAGEYAGTFKWSHKKDFTVLPTPDRSTKPMPPVDGWTAYLGERLDSDGDDGNVIVEPSMLDALSFPLSLIWAIRQIITVRPEFKDWLLQSPKRLTVLALGCSARAEEHVLLHTNYFAELGHYLPGLSLDLWLVGPEMSTSHHQAQRVLTANLTAHCFRGTTQQFLQQHPPAAEASGTNAARDGTLLSGKVLAICYNTGMASGDAALQASWAQDVRHLLDLHWPLIFTCANDHTDLKGERQLMEGHLKAQYLLFPRKNAFGAITTLHPPGGRDTSWYAANAFIYAVQGYAGGQATKEAPTPSPTPIIQDNLDLPD